MNNQIPDNRPGNYYVSVVNGDKTSLLLGPFINDHQAALDAVDKILNYTVEIYRESVWYSFGTVRLSEDCPKHSGLFNDQFRFSESLDEFQNSA